MAGTRLIRLSVVLHTVVLALTEVSLQYERSQGNHIRYQDLKTTNCSLGPSQESISCIRLDLKDVPHDLFPGVEELNLSFNQIRYITNSSFRPYSRLRILSLFYNYIGEIAIGSFHSMPDLENLDLGYNANLKSITSEMFRISTKLAYLSFDGDLALEFIPSDILRWLPNLRILNLNDTAISQIKITTCSSPLRKLNIYLENNSITNITNSTFVIDCELNSLHLEPIGRPQILTIDPYTLATLRSKTFSLVWNTMSSELWKLFFIGIGNSKIEELILHNAYIEDIDPHYYAPMQNSKLQVLDLSHNNFTSITKQGFLDLPRIHTLVLDRCQIGAIYPEDFARMKGLRVLHLNYNHISDIGDFSQ